MSNTSEDGCTLILVIILICVVLFIAMRADGLALKAMERLDALEAENDQ